jgi:ectoine hydroxylase-related dioxygenase (phytanoyl-CoA dioxygenase family)
VNLNPCGPDDGALIVCEVGHLISEKFHKEMSPEPRIPAWTPEWFGFTENGMRWLEDHGYEWHGVCAEPGDLILWDSRTPHYNVPTQTAQDRFAVYTCFMPVKDATQEGLRRKKDAFDSKPCPRSPAQIVTNTVQNDSERLTGLMHSTLLDPTLPSVKASPVR